MGLNPTLVSECSSTDEGRRSALTWECSWWRRCSGRRCSSCCRWWWRRSAPRRSPRPGSAVGSSQSTLGPSAALQQQRVAGWEMGGRMDGRADGRADGRTGRWTGRTDRRMDGRAGGQRVPTYLYQTMLILRFFKCTCNSFFLLDLKSQLSYRLMPLYTVSVHYEIIVHLIWNNCRPFNHCSIHKRVFTPAVFAAFVYVAAYLYAVRFIRTPSCIYAPDQKPDYAPPR